MFRVHFPNLQVRIEGCPESGIEAIDFRRKHGLPEAPNNLIAIPIDLTSEPLVRQFVRFADNDGDLKDRRGFGERLPYNDKYGHASGDKKKPSLVGTTTERDYLVQHVVAPAAVLAGLSGTDDGIGLLLSELAEDKAGQDRNRMESKALAEKEAKIAAATAEILADDDAIGKCICYVECDDAGKRWRLQPNHPQRTLLSACRSYEDVFPKSTCVPALQPLVDAVADEIKKRNADELAQHQAAIAAAQREQDAWITAHGSERLKRSLAEGIATGAAYRDERLAVERPGWKWLENVPGNTKEPRNPPLEAFALLDEARRCDPESYLQFYSADAKFDEFGDEVNPAVRGYVAEAEFLGEFIVYGVERLSSSSDEDDE